MKSHNDKCGMSNMKLFYMQVNRCPNCGVQINWAELIDEWREEFKKGNEIYETVWNGIAQ